MGKELDLFEALKAMEEGKKVVCLYKLGGEDHYYQIVGWKLFRSR